MADGQRHLSFNISETKYGKIHLATDIAITSKGLVDRPKKKYILPYPFNSGKAIKDVETGVCGIVIPPTNTMFRYSFEACNILQTDDFWQ